MILNRLCSFFISIPFTISFYIVRFRYFKYNFRRGRGVWAWANALGGGFVCVGGGGVFGGVTFPLVLYRLFNSETCPSYTMYHIQSTRLRIQK